MSAHTPGPWEWDGDVWEYDRETEAPWLMSAKTGMPVIQGDIDCMRDDAILIAAAPDLLEALIHMVSVAERDGWQTATTGRQLFLWDAKVAIAKAKGETQ
jgi:hypothetical protein